MYSFKESYPIRCTLPSGYSNTNESINDNEAYNSLNILLNLLIKAIDLLELYSNNAL